MGADRRVASLGPARYPPLMSWRFGESAVGNTTSGGRLGSGWALCAVCALAALVLGSSEARAADPAPNAAKPPAAPDEATPAARVTFTGFVRRMDKGASIFVRLTGEVPVVEERAGRRIVYHLTGAKLGVPNNGNPLPTEHFGPPVSHVALLPSNGGVDLVIDLVREPEGSGPTHRMVTQGKLATLHVDLPPAAR
jgi:hypothetical protein